MDDTQYRNPARAVLIDARSEVHFLRVRVIIKGFSQPNNRIGRSQLDLRKWRSLHRNHYFPFLLNWPRPHDFSARGSIISSVQYRARKQAAVAPVSRAAARARYCTGSPILLRLGKKWYRAPTLAKDSQPMQNGRVRLQDGNTGLNPTKNTNVFPSAIFHQLSQRSPN